jgi:hypothetical protein
MMFEEMPHLAPLVPGPKEVVEALAAQVPGPPHPIPPPDPEQAHAAEAVFAAQEQESEAVAGLLGMWTGTMLLNDLAKEHFSRPEDEEEEEEKGRKGKKEG